MIARNKLTRRQRISAMDSGTFQHRKKWWRGRNCQSRYYHGRKWRLHWFYNGQSIHPKNHKKSHFCQSLSHKTLQQVPRTDKTEKTLPRMQRKILAQLWANFQCPIFNPIARKLVQQTHPKASDITILTTTKHVYWSSAQLLHHTEQDTSVSTRTLRSYGEDQLKSRNSYLQAAHPGVNNNMFRRRERRERWQHIAALSKSIINIH